MTGGGMITLNMTDLVGLSYAKWDLSDVWVNTTNMTTWRNHTEGNNTYYFIVNATNRTTFEMQFGNYIANISQTNTTNATGLMVNVTDVSGYTELYPYYVLTFYEETDGTIQIPPDANRTCTLYCSNGSSWFDLNDSKFIIPTYEELDEIKASISYSVTETYYRNLIVRSDVEYKNFYLVDANENQVVQMLIEMQDNTGDFSGAVFKVKKTVEATEETITEGYFDAENKILIYLINGDRYQIYIDNGVEERSIGNFYVDSVDLTKTLSINPIYDYNMTTVGNISYRLYRRNATIAGDAIIFSYFDGANQTRNVSMWVYNHSNSSQPYLYFTSSTNHSSVYFIYPITDLNSTYRAVIHINHTQFGQDSWAFEDVFAAVVGAMLAPRSLSLYFPIQYVYTLGYIMIMSVPMLFTPPTGATAGVFVVLIAMIIMFWNWFPVNIVVVALALALAVLNKMRSKT